ncbi:TraB/GumN family protein [Frateuria defendens]|uniref:TraB/GumN family protein n=1 Tax=Frateuria defendens TaxID=2219559 RepID=UPI00066FF38E|nr:TraB/GumN family protein [Frateuria defendens]
MFRKPKSWLALLLALGASLAQAQDAPAPAASAGAITNLQTVTVSGVQPGPGLWKVSRGGHTLWVLGLIRTLPERMQWRSGEVAEVIAQSQEVLEPPSVQVKADTNFLGKLFLLPSVYSARKNEDGKTLDQVLPSALYARWQPLKQQYLGNGRGVERWRPIFAAMELYKKALRQHGLRGNGEIGGTVDALAKQHGVKQTLTQYQLVIEKPRQAIKAFKQAGPDDVACFGRTLDSIEHDLPAITERANAWATGDLATLRRLPDSRYRDACVEALTGAGFARELGISDVPARVEAGWLAAAERALAANTTTFAMLPMDSVLDAGGYLAKLKAKGYTVLAPDEDEGDAEDAPAAAGSTAR